MAKRKFPPRMNYVIPPKTNKRLNDYIVRRTQKNGKITHAIKSKIGKMSLEEWLDEHENDVTIKIE